MSFHRLTLRRALILVPVVLVLAACASSKENVIPNDGPTMLEIYRAHQLSTGSGIPDSHAALATAPGGAVMPVHLDEDVPAPAAKSYARDESRALDQQFVRLPNPDLVMYVPAHLSGAGTPVPGYVTVLPMYEQVQYAMPGEIAPSARRLNWE